MVPVADLHELGADAQPVPRLAHTPSSTVATLKLRTDLGEVDRRPAERERRGTRGHAQARQLGEGVDDLFGDAR